MRKKKYRCEICGEQLSEDEVYELDGMILCWDCYNEEEDLRGIRRGMDRVINLLITFPLSRVHEK